MKPIEKVKSEEIREAFEKLLKKNYGCSDEVAFTILQTLLNNYDIYEKGEELNLIENVLMPGKPGDKEKDIIIQEFLAKQSKLRNKIERMITLFPSENGKEHFTHALLTEILFDVTELI